MSKEVIRFSKAVTDLQTTDNADELWQKTCYESRSSEVREYVMRKKKAYPAKQMNFIREGVIEYHGDVSMESLKQLASKISIVFPMECFQILIERKKGKIHMLFDCYDRDNMESFYLYEAYHNKLSAIIINELNLNVSTDSSKWYRYIMIENYNEDPKLFVKMKEWAVKNTSDDIAKKMLNIFGFCENICSKTLKADCQMTITNH